MNLYVWVAIAAAIGVALGFNVGWARTVLLEAGWTDVWLWGGLIFATVLPFIGPGLLQVLVTLQFASGKA
jgi:hypothetical protein